MKKILVTALFMLATLAWAEAQQPGSGPGQSGSQAPAPSSQMPGASESQPAAPGSPDQGTQSGMQGGSQSAPANVPITEGCLAGSAPNFTITDQAGTTYKLNIPSSADTSKLAQHVGESARVAGDLKGTSTPGNASIDVQGIGRGSGKCPVSGSSTAPPSPKQ